MTLLPTASGSHSSQGHTGHLPDLPGKILGPRQSYTAFNCGVGVHTCNLSTQEPEPEQGESKCEASLGHIVRSGKVRPCLKNETNEEERKGRKAI